jgi:hypothetical protein
MGLGQLRGPSWETGALLAAPIRSPLSRTAGWRSVTDGPDVCDENSAEVRIPKRPSAAETNMLTTYVLYYSVSI